MLLFVAWGDLKDRHMSAGVLALGETLPNLYILTLARTGSLIIHLKLFLTSMGSASCSLPRSAGLRYGTCLFAQRLFLGSVILCEHSNHTRTWFDDTFWGFQHGFTSCLSDPIFSREPFCQPDFNRSFSGWGVSPTEAKKKKNARCRGPKPDSPHKILSPTFPEVKSPGL